MLIFAFCELREVFTKNKGHGGSDLIFSNINVDSNFVIVNVCYTEEI